MNRTPEETAVLIQRGETALIPELWAMVGRYVRCKAMRQAAVRGYAGGVTADDLTQCAYFAMLSAISTFDPARAYFIKHLSWYMLHEFDKATGYRCKRNPLDRASCMDTWFYEIIPDPADPYASVEAREAKEAVGRAVKQLPDDAREVIRRRYYLEQSAKQVGMEMGISWRTVYRWESRALEMLRAVMS